MSKSTKRVVWSLGAEVVQMVAGLAIFVTLAKRLSLADVAYMTTALAFAALISSISTLGARPLLMRRLGADVPVVEAHSRAVFTGVFGAGLGVLILLAVQHWALPEISTLTFAELLLGQLVFILVVELCVALAVGLDDLASSFRIRAQTAVIRLLGLIGFLLFSSSTLQSWAHFAVVFNALAACAAMLAARRTHNATLSSRDLRWTDVSEGIPYGLGGSAEAVLAGADGPVLLRYGFVDDNARYGVASRLVQLGMVPLLALIRSAESRIYRAGAESFDACRSAARKLSLPVAAAGVAVGAVFLAASGALPTVLGDKYDEAVPIMRALSALPLIRGLQYVAGNVLTASGFQTRRLRMVVAAGILNLGLNLVFIPDWSWKAALASTYVAEILLLVGFCTRPRDEADSSATS